AGAGQHRSRVVRRDLAVPPLAWSTCTMVRLPLPCFALTAASLLFVDGALAETPPPRPPATGKTAAVAAAPRPPAKALPKKTPARKKPKADKPAPVLGAVVSSPAFRMLDEGKSRVFVEVSQKVPVSEQKAKGRVVYKLKGAAVPVRNSLRPLLTNFFPTPV